MRAALTDLDLVGDARAGVRAALDTLDAEYALLTAGARARHEVEGAFDARMGVRPAISRFVHDFSPGADGNVEQFPVGGRTDWVNISRALGRRDGSSSTIAGSAAGARGGELSLTPLGSIFDQSFAIDSVHLHFYAAQAGTLLADGSLTLRYRIGVGAAVTLATFSGDVDGLTSPFVYDITSAIGSWQDLTNLSARAVFSAALGQTYTASLDAVHFVVSASKDL
jgi:hypothetical protein